MAEKRSQGAVHVAAEVLVAELEQRELGCRRGRAIERLHPLPGRGEHGRRAWRRIVTRSGGDDLRPQAHRDGSPVTHDVHEAGARERRAQDLEVTSEGRPLREHPLATVPFAKRGQAVADGSRSRPRIGEQVVPDLPLLARSRAQPSAPRRVPLVPGVWDEPSRGSSKPAPGRRWRPGIVPSRNVNWENQARSGW